MPKRAAQLPNNIILEIMRKDIPGISIVAACNATFLCAMSQVPDPPVAALHVSLCAVIHRPAHCKAIYHGNFITRKVHTSLHDP